MPNFKLELKKLFKSKKLILLLLLSIVIPAAVLYQNHTNADRYALGLFKKVQEMSFKMYQAKQQYRERMTEVDLPPEKIEEAMYYFSLLEVNMQALNSLPRQYAVRYEIPRLMVGLYNTYQKYAEDRTANYNGRQFFYMHDENDTDRVAIEKAYFQRLVDLNLPYEDPIYSKHGFNFVKSVVVSVWGMPFALLLVILLADVFSGEKENGTEKMRQTQPVKRRNILSAKLFAAFIYVLTFFLAMLTVSYLLAGLLGSGFGTPYYPLEVNFGFIDTCGPVWQYLSLALLYYSLYLLVIISALALFATIVKETSITAALGILLVFIGDLLGTKTAVSNPFSYFNFYHYLSRAQGRPLLMTGVSLGISTAVSLLAHYLGKTTLVQDFTLSPRGKDGDAAVKKNEGKKTRPFPVFRFETLKILKKRTVVTPLFLLLVLTMLLGLNRYSSYEEFHDKEVTSCQVVMIHLLSKAALPEGIREEDADQSDYNRAYQAYSNALEAHKIGDVGMIIQAQKEIFADGFDTQHSFYPPEAATVYYATQDEILKRGVQPVYANSTMLRGLVHSPFAGAEDLNRIRNGNIRNSQPSVTFILNSLFKDGLAVLALALLAVSLAQGFSDETHDTRTVFFLNTQPLSRKRIYFGKLIAQGAVFLAMVLIMAAVLFGGLKLAGSPTEANFPAVKYLNSIGDDYTGSRLWRSNLSEHLGKSLPASGADIFVGFTFRDMMAENLEMVLLLVLSGLSLVAFALLISMKIRHKIGVSLGAALFFGLGYLASRYVLKGVGTFLPFIWLNSPLVATGEASMIFNWDLLTGPMGLAVLALWLAVFVFLGYRIYSKTGRYL